MIDALRKLGVKATATELRDYIAAERSGVGIYGQHDFVKDSAARDRDRFGRHDPLGCGPRRLGRRERPGRNRAQVAEAASITPHERRPATRQISMTPGRWLQLRSTALADGTPCLVGTASKSGDPQISPKGSVAVLDEKTLSRTGGAQQPLISSRTSTRTRKVVVYYRNAAKAEVVLRAAPSASTAPPRA